MRVELTNSNWVEIRDPDTLKTRDRNAILGGLDDVEGGKITMGLAVLAGLKVAMIEEWSFDLPLPSADPGALDELRIADTQLIEDALGEVAQELFPNFSAAGADGRVAITEGTPTSPS